MDRCYLSLLLSSSPGEPSVADKLVTQYIKQEPGQPLVPGLSLWCWCLFLACWNLFFFLASLSPAGPMTWDGSAPTRNC